MFLFCLLIYSGSELREQLKWRHSLDALSALPQKGGVKDYAPDGSWLQERKLENFYSERLSILREERVHTKSVVACPVSVTSYICITITKPKNILSIDILTSQLRSSSGMTFGFSHAAARLALGLSSRDHVSAALKKLHWLPVTHRIQYKLSLMIFKVRSHQCPDYMSNIVSLVSDDPGRRRLRSAASTDYHVLRTRTKLGDRAFSIAGLKAWNNLPQSVRSADSLIVLSENLNFIFLTHVSVFELLMYVYSYCNALSARFLL